MHAWKIDYSQRAENVYKQAQELVKSLDEADIAQQRAKDAIEQANEDIALAKADLEKVNLKFPFFLDYKAFQ